jgi:hypothetical protein
LFKEFLPVDRITATCDTDGRMEYNIIMPYFSTDRCPMIMGLVGPIGFISYLNPIIFMNKPTFTTNFE